MTHVPASPPVVIGIAGGSGSGKTTVAHRIVERLGADALALLSHDSYYRDLRLLPRTDRDQVNFDHPEALETSRLVEDLRRLRSGLAADIPTYDFTTHSRTAEVRRVDPRPVVLLEGILIFADAALLRELDVKIFVDADADVRLLRRLRRDVAERGRTVESVLDQYEATVRPMHIEFVEPSKRHADLILPQGGHNGVALDFLLSRIGDLVG